MPPKRRIIFLAKHFKLADATKKERCSYHTFPVLVSVIYLHLAKEIFESYFVHFTVPTDCEKFLMANSNFIFTQRPMLLHEIEYFAFSKSTFELCGALREGKLGGVGAELAPRHVHTMEETIDGIGTMVHLDGYCSSGAL